MGDDRKAGELDIKYHIPSIRYQIQDYRGPNPLIIFAVLVAVSKLSKIFIDIVDTFQRLCVCVFIPSPVRVGTLLMEVPGTPIGASFFKLELKPTGKDSADQTQHEFQHHIV